MDQGIGAVVRLPGSDRKDLAIQALAGSETVSDLAARHGVSRKFVHQQTHKARAALDGAFASATPGDHEVLFELAVSKAWLRQVIAGLALICHSSYRGVVVALKAGECLVGQLSIVRFPKASRHLRVSELS